MKIVEKIKSLFKKKNKINKYIYSSFLLSLPLIDPFCRNFYGKSSLDMDWDELQFALKDFNNKFLGNEE